MINNHWHSGLWWDWQKIKYSDIVWVPTDTVSYYQVNDTTWTVWYTAWNFTITCWFRPKKIIILATWDSWQPWASEWLAIVDTAGAIHNWCKYNDWSYTNSSLISASNIIYIKNASNSTIWTVTAISDTWFTLNINNTNWNFNTLITVEW